MHEAQDEYNCQKYEVYLPEAHDVIWSPADKENDENDDGHLEGSIPGSVEKDKAGAAETVVRTQLVAPEDLRDDTGI